MWSAPIFTNFDIKLTVYPIDIPMYIPIPSWRWRNQHRGGMQTPLGQRRVLKIQHENITCCGNMWEFQWGIPPICQFENRLMMINHQI
jgi:hypothetical protein